MRRLVVPASIGTLMLTTLPALPAQAALPDIAVTCPDLGEVGVRFNGPATQPGAAATTVDGPVTVQSVAFGTSRSAVPDPHAITCDPVTVQGRRSDFLPDGDQSATTGTLTVSVLVDSERAVTEAAATNRSTVRAAAVANDPAGYGEVVPFPYRSQIAAFTSTRSGSVAAALRPAGATTIYSFVKGSATNVTASIVKVQVMAAVMVRAQRAGRSLTAWEKSQIVPMIRYSDNGATTALWKSLGGGPAVKPVLDRMGLRNTVPGPGGFWGLTVTSAPDNVVLVDHFSRRNPVISDANRAYGLSLMRIVASDQDWGVTAGPGDDIAVKNGWLPRTDGWHVNSIGYNHKRPQPYTAAVLTHSTTAGMSTQIATIEGVSRIMRSRTRTARGDWTGDGRADVAAFAGDRRWLVPSRNGQLGTPSGANGGWRHTWYGSPGDMTGDGRSDLLARGSDGRLWLYPGASTGFSAPRLLGRGWNEFSAITVLDLDGNGQADAVARDRSGRLVRYRLSATAAPVRVGVVGTGWQSIRPVGVGDFTNDGRDDLVGITADGRLLAYRSTGSGLAGLGQRGAGWGFANLTGPGDVDGDLVPDLVAWDGAQLRLYRMTRSGGFRTVLTSPGVTGLRLLA